MLQNDNQTIQLESARRVAKMLGVQAPRLESEPSKQGARKRPRVDEDSDDSAGESDS